MPRDFPRDIKMKSGPHPQAVELMHQRTAWSKHFRNPDGNITSVFEYGMHFRDANGQWQERDLRFRQAGADYVSDQHAVHVAIRGATLEIEDAATGKGIRWILPGMPAVGGAKARFAADGLDWEYALTMSGVKLSAVVLAPRGPHTYTFHPQLIGGATPLAKDASGSLVSGADFGVRRAVVVGADGSRHECGPWQLRPGNRVAFDWDDSGLPASAYPYTLDPTTFSIATSGNDGYAWGSYVSYPPPVSGSDITGSSVITARAYTGSDYQIYVGLVRWDTSSLPDGAVISAASAKLYGVNKADTDSRALTGEWYEPGTIGTDDYTSTAGGGAHGGTSLASLSTGAYNTIALENVTSISTTGYTGIRWHINGGQPTGNNSFYFQSIDGGADVAQLVVTYNTPPDTPTGTFPTGTVSGNADITAEGTDTEAGDTLQFEWDISSNSGGDWTTIPAGNLSPAANPTAAVAQSTPQTVALVTTAYVNGATYRLRVRAYDGVAYGAYDTQGADFTIANKKSPQMMI